MSIWVESGRGAHGSKFNLGPAIFVGDTAHREARRAFDCDDCRTALNDIAALDVLALVD